MKGSTLYLWTPGFIYDAVIRYQIAGLEIHKGAGLFPQGLLNILKTVYVSGPAVM